LSPADAMFRVVRGCVCSQARGARDSKESWESICQGLSLVPVVRTQKSLTSSRWFLLD
jgi:hypothetical protein